MAPCVERTRSALLLFLLASLVLSLPTSTAHAWPEEWREDWCDDNDTWREGGRTCEVREVTTAASRGLLRVDPGHLTGSRFDGKGLEARTQNGPATLVLPKNYNATVEYGTRNGPWDGRVASRPREFRTTRFGKGGPPIAVTTENGPYVLIRADR